MKRILCVGAVWGDSRPTAYGISREQWFMAQPYKGGVVVASGPMGPMFWFLHGEWHRRFPLGPRRADVAGFPL